MIGFMYEYVNYIPLFSKKLHNTHSSMTVIFQQKRIVNAVLQSLIINHIHPYVYWREKIEKSKVHWRICLGNYLMEIALWSLHSKLLQMIIYNISWIFIDYYTGIWLSGLEDWRWKHTNAEIYLTNYWIWHYFRIMQNTLRYFFWWSHGREPRMWISLSLVPTI